MNNVRDAASNDGRSRGGGGGSGGGRVSAARGTSRLDRISSGWALLRQHSGRTSQLSP